jgi:hypothetical protein
MYTEGQFYHQSKEVYFQDIGAAILFLCGVFLIARRQVSLVLRRGTKQQATGNCPFCGYSTGDLKVCPECGHATDGSEVRDLYLTRLHLRIAKSWWSVPITICICILIASALCAPLTHGLLRILSQRLGI